MMMNSDGIINVIAISQSRPQFEYARPWRTPSSSKTSCRAARASSRSACLRCATTCAARASWRRWASRTYPTLAPAASVWGHSSGFECCEGACAGEKSAARGPHELGPSRVRVALEDGGLVELSFGPAASSPVFAVSILVRRHGTCDRPALARCKKRNTLGFLVRYHKYSFLRFMKTSINLM